MHCAWPLLVMDDCSAAAPLRGSGEHGKVGEMDHADPCRRAAKALFYSLIVSVAMPLNPTRHRPSSSVLFRPPRLHVGCFRPFQPSDIVSRHYYLLTWSFQFLMLLPASLQLGCYSSFYTRNIASCDDVPYAL
jgi:hypothetical protein